MAIFSVDISFFLHYIQCIPLKKRSKPGDLLFREPQAGVMRQEEVAEWTSEGEQKRATGVWETERLSVNKAGI